MWINNFHIFGDFAPFGGYKQSGVGRELGGVGLAEYTQVKRVHMNTATSRKANYTMSLFSDDPRVDWLQYLAPTKVLAGHGTLAGLPQAVVSLGCRRAMILTDVGVRQAGLTQFVQDALCDFCVGVFDDIPADSDLATVDAATARARELTADCIVSVGGGSVIDTAKAVCVTLKNGGEANDHIALMRLTEPQIPHIAIPTTAGTGSEVTNVAVIHNRKLDRKVYIVDTNIIPDVAILDPRLTMTLPARLTAATGMDAITHAVEALTSTLAQTVCDGQALHALRLMKEFLPRAVANGEDEQARIQVSVAACMAGWAFSTAQVGLAHSMAHTIGTLHHAHHGTVCGIVLPKVMRFNAEYAAPKLAMAAQALGVDTTNMSDHDAALAAADRLAADPANQPAARLLKGDVYVSAGRFAEAVATYGVELRSDPNSALVLRNAAALGAAGRTDQAAQGLRDWLAVHPDDTDVAAALASLDLVARRFYDAETHLQMVLGKRPNDANALNNLAWVYQQRNDPRARGVAQKAYLISPTPQIADTLGWILTGQGDAATGLTLLRQAAALQQDEPTVQYHLAVALNAAGQREDAVAVLRPIVLGAANFDEKQEAAGLLQKLLQGAKGATDPKVAKDAKDPKGN